MTQGFVLDVDDTLYLERDYVRSGFAAVGTWCLDELGVDGVGARSWTLFEAGRRGTTLTDALRDCGVDPDADLARRMIEVYRSHEPGIALLADAARFLERIRGHPIAVVTDGPAVSQRAKCRALGLLELADPVVITAEHRTSKPDPAVYEHVAVQWGLPASELVYIADNPAKDFIAPLTLGWAAVRVRRRESLHVDASTPDGVLELGDLDRFPDNPPV